jgi:hypothetical protein
MSREIQKICNKYGIENYTINSDGTVDVDGDVLLGCKGLTKLPIYFNYVSGNFYCNNNQLVSLKGCPKEVGNNFDCYNNKLKSLEGCPQEVGGYFDCQYNQLKSLEKCPKKVGGNFYCHDNPLPREIKDNPKSYLKQINRSRKINEILND